MTPKNTSSEASARPRVGVLLADRENAFWTDFKRCFEIEARRMALDIKCFWSEPNKDRVGQLDTLLELITSGFEALIINPLDNANLAPGIRQAAERRLPILDVGAKTDPALVSDAAPYYVPVNTVDFEEQGRLAAGYIMKRFTGAESYHVAVLEGRASSRQSIGRTEGALAVFTQSGICRVVLRTQADFDRVKACQTALATMDASNAIDAWCCANDLMALGVSDAYATAQSGRRPVRRRPVIVGVDLIDEARNAIASGRMDASVAFSRTEVARHVLAAAVDIINHRKSSTAYGVKSVLVTRENLDAWIA